MEKTYLMYWSFTANLTWTMEIAFRLKRQSPFIIEC